MVGGERRKVGSLVCTIGCGGQVMEVLVWVVEVVDGSWCGGAFCDGDGGDESKEIL